LQGGKPVKPTAPTGFIEIYGAGDGNRTHVRSLGSKTLKNVRIGGFLTFFENFKWIPIGAAATIQK
jgi:hypothetical protein